MLEDSGRESIISLRAEDCPFCDDWEHNLRSRRISKDRGVDSAMNRDAILVSTTRFKRHVATHQEQLAMFAMPRGLEGEGEGDEDQMRSSRSTNISISTAGSAPESAKTNDLEAPNSMKPELLHEWSIRGLIHPDLGMPINSPIPQSPSEGLSAEAGADHKISTNTSNITPRPVEQVESDSPILTFSANHLDQNLGMAPRVTDTKQNGVLLRTPISQHETSERVDDDPVRRARTMLVANGIDTASLTTEQFQAFATQSPAGRAKSMIKFLKDLEQYKEGQIENPQISDAVDQGDGQGIPHRPRDPAATDSIARAREVLLSSGINPEQLAPQQLQTFADQPPIVQATSIATYLENIEKHSTGQKDRQTTTEVAGRQEEERSHIVPQDPSGINPNASISGKYNLQLPPFDADNQPDDGVIRRALKRANDAILADNSGDLNGAIQCYMDSNSLLRKVSDRTDSEDDRAKLGAIVSSCFPWHTTESS
jgi:hypothetical protein